MGGVALAGMINNRKAFGVGLPGVYHMRHTALPQNKFVKGQPEHGADLADDLQRYCALYGGENIAAVFVEPTAVSFGCLPPPKGYLDRLRAICDPTPKRSNQLSPSRLTRSCPKSRYAAWQTSSPDFRHTSIKSQNRLWMGAITRAQKRIVR